ncbi:hypothetical protein [Caballeronia sp. LZ028]|uniref:hypothetical protein n=1 Tax=Caballeronia sp. LZ028 TaxID=3038563 RepID=UPI002865BB29|nr:hypothetical protein [Caballeronia sp. LZ028]MDR5766891.1 hypothetical protein [Caballeronia sp. LZ028]
MSITNLPAVRFDSDIESIDLARESIHGIRRDGRNDAADERSHRIIWKEIKEIDEPACEKQPECAVRAEQQRAEQPNAGRKINPVHASHELGMSKDFLIGPERGDKDERRSDDGT